MQTADGGSRDNYRDREAPAVGRPADAVDLLAVSLALAAVHFGAPMAYHVETKRWLKRPWDVKRGVQHTLTVTVVIPTYNEARNIEEKLEYVYSQDYPRDRLEITVVDSASTDGTAERARRWAAAHPDADVKIVEEPQRRGKNAAEALAMGVLVVVMPEVAENLAAERKPLGDSLVVAVHAAVPAWRDVLQKYLDLCRP